MRYISIYIYVYNIRETQQFRISKTVRGELPENLEYFISSLFYEEHYERPVFIPRNEKKSREHTGQEGGCRGVGLDIEGKRTDGGNLTYCYVLI